ncbi:MAG: iron-sulfur cluster assembly scaffold protein [Candidatus Acidiferrales bacterium]
MADTINTGTEPTEENALMPESLPFESEPWTSFYMAGEIIRELRQPSGKPSEYTSEGNMAHSDKVIDHSDHPCDVGSLPKDNPNVGTGFVGAPLSGHVMEPRIRINPEVQVIEEEAEFKTFGCGSAIVSSSLTTELVKGKTSRKRWPSRTRISSASSAFPHAILSDATRYSRTGGRLHLVGSPIF